MRNSFVAFAVILSTIIMASCKKERQTVADTLLTGTWVRGTSAGDTLYFLQANNKNILRYNASFNPALPVSTDVEYGFVNNKLLLKRSMLGQTDYYIIESFKWIIEGKEFEILGHEIFPFMSSTTTRFTYRKVS